MGDQQERPFEGKEPRARPNERNYVSRVRCNSRASVPMESGGAPVDHRGSHRTSINTDVAECWVAPGVHENRRVVQYNANNGNRGGEITSSRVQRNSNVEGALEGQELSDSMKRAMEKRLRSMENQQSYQAGSWNQSQPICKREREATMKANEHRSSTSPIISTKDELLRVYRESIRRGELASLCMKTKRGRETLTLSVMLKSQEGEAARNCREEAFDCYVSPETFHDYLPMCPKARPDHGNGEFVQNGADIIKHHHH